MGKEITIEGNFEQLEGIINQMQKDNISLEDSFSLYEQGIKALKECNKRIDAVEKKMLKLNEQGELEEF